MFAQFEAMRSMPYILDRAITAKPSRNVAYKNMVRYLLAGQLLFYSAAKNLSHRLNLRICGLTIIFIAIEILMMMI
jgi:hypothetical protein